MEPVAALKVSERHASGLAFTPDGAGLVAGGMAGALKVWSCNDWSLTREVPGHDASVNTIAFQNDLALTGSSDRTVRLWRLPSWQEADVLPGYVDLAATEGALAVRKERGDQIHRFDLATRRISGAAHTRLRRITALHGVRDRVIVGALDGTVQVRSASDLALVTTLGGHEGGVTSLSTTADGRRLLVADADGHAHLWDLEGHEREATLALGTAGYFFAAIAPGGERIASAGDGRIALHDLDGHVLDAHEPGVKGTYGVRWSPDGRLFANAAADGLVRVFRA